MRFLLDTNICIYALKQNQVVLTRLLAERPIDATHRVLIARWTLTGKETQSGYTTLVFARQGDRWRIVTDHSS